MKKVLILLFLIMQVQIFAYTKCCVCKENTSPIKNKDYLKELDRSIKERIHPIREKINNKLDDIIKEYEKTVKNNKRELNLTTYEFALNSKKEKELSDVLKNKRDINEANKIEVKAMILKIEKKLDQIFKNSKSNISKKIEENFTKGKTK